MAMTMDEAAAAAERLALYWRSPRALDLRTRQLCSRLAEAVDASGAMAAEVRADSGATAARVADAVRHAAHDDPAVGGMIRRLAPEPAADHGGYSATQNVSIGGNGNVGIVVGRDLHTGGRDPAELARRAAGIGAGVGPGRGETGAPTEPAPPDAILLVAADPVDLVRLRLGFEERLVREVLELSAGRGRWAVHTWNSVRLRDLTGALLRLRPSVLHFSGHGCKDGGILLEDDTGLAHEVPPDAFARIFGTIRSVECVVLNACYSEPQGRALSAHVPFVVGTPGALADEAATAFSLGFYQALGAGCRIPEAYELGCVHMRASGTAQDQLPKLIRRD